MALVESEISSQLFSLINAVSETDGEKAQKQFCDNIAKVVVSAIKSATIVIPAGQTVSTAGTATAQTGVTTDPSPPAEIN